MKQKVSMMVAILLLSTACTRHTEFGNCVGVLDPKRKDPGYEISYWNAGIAIMFSATVVVPAVVIFDDLYCPEAYK